MTELVWIHRANANELGISQTPEGTGRGAFFLVPVDARPIFFLNVVLLIQKQIFLNQFL